MRSFAIQGLGIPANTLKRERQNCNDILSGNFHILIEWYNNYQGSKSDAFDHVCIAFDKLKMNKYKNELKDFDDSTIRVGREPQTHLDVRDIYNV